jgi:hypothetical protein
MPILIREREISAIISLRLKCGDWLHGGELLAWLCEPNNVLLNNSSRRGPLKLSMKAFCCNLPGAIYCSCHRYAGQLRALI